MVVVHVDLSSPELDSTAVLQLIKEHGHKRPAANILFKVSQRTFNLYQQSVPEKVVTVSEAEAEEMNKFLDRSWQVSDYVVGERVPCSNCGRVLNFYDVFQSGRKQHGDDYLRQILGGEEYHLHVAKKDQTLDVECTACGALNNIFVVSEDASTHGSYCSPKYYYA